MPAKQENKLAWPALMLGGCFLVWGIYKVIGSPGTNSANARLGVLFAFGSCLYLLAVGLFLRSLSRAANFGRRSKANAGIILIVVYSIVAIGLVALQFVEIIKGTHRFNYSGAGLMWFGVLWISVGLTGIIEAKGISAPKIVPKSVSSLKGPHPPHKVSADEAWYQTQADEEAISNATSGNPVTGKAGKKLP